MAATSSLKHHISNSLPLASDLQAEPWAVTNYLGMNTSCQSTPARWADGGCQQAWEVSVEERVQRGTTAHRTDTQANSSVVSCCWDAVPLVHKCLVSPWQRLFFFFLFVHEVFFVPWGSQKCCKLAGGVKGTVIPVQGREGHQPRALLSKGLCTDLWQVLSNLRGHLASVTVGCDKYRDL